MSAVQFHFITFLGLTGPDLKVLCIIHIQSVKVKRFQGAIELPHA